VLDEHLGTVDEIDHRLFGPIRQIHAPHRDCHYFGAGCLMASRHFLKAAVFARTDEQTRMKLAIRDAKYVRPNYIRHDAHILSQGLRIDTMLRFKGSEHDHTPLSCRRNRGANLTRRLYLREP
jgi:hypothetical protein